MNVAKLPILFLSSAAIFATGTLFAETDPMSGQPTSGQSARQQQQPGAQSSTIRNESAMQDTGPGATGQTMKDKIFLRKAAEGGMAEIQLGQLAAQKAGSEDVKTFAQKMITDHTDLNNDLKPFADGLGVSAPKKLSSKDQAEYDKLNSLSGDDFDKEYLAYMVKDHHEDLREFRKEAESTTDPSLRAEVDKAETVIRHHTGMVSNLARSKGVSMPGRTASAPTAQ